MKRSTWGFGLFLLEDANPRDLVTGLYACSFVPVVLLLTFILIEYCGELVYDDTTGSRA